MWPQLFAENKYETNKQKEAENYMQKKCRGKIPIIFPEPCVYYWNNLIFNFIFYENYYSFIFSIWNFQNPAIMNHNLYLISPFGIQILWTQPSYSSPIVIQIVKLFADGGAWWKLLQVEDSIIRRWLNQHTV